MKVMGVYVGQQGRENFEVGLQTGTWGWSEDWSEPATLAPGDLVVIAQGGGGRHDLDAWMLRTASTVAVGRITQGYHRSDTPVWPDEKRGERTYPYRVRFELLGRASNVPFAHIARGVNKLMQVSATKQGRGLVTTITADDTAALLGIISAAAAQPWSPPAPTEQLTPPADEPTATEPAAPDPGPGTDDIASVRARTSPTAWPNASFDLDWLERETLWTPSALQELIDTLTQRRPQIVLSGPPGTGKTWLAKALATYLTQGRPGGVHTVQFHPSYGYEDFVKGLRPVARAGGVSFEPVDGAFVRAADHARSVDHPVVLIIDEMNRANLPRVLGELLYLLEYRGEKIELTYGGALSAPPNLYIVATMNTADRSARSLDAALRRRFDFFECPPDTAILGRYYTNGHVTEVDGLAEGLTALNERLVSLLDRHHTIGHTFLMRDRLTAADLRHTWTRQLLPLIEEYLFDQPEIVDELDIGDFWPLLPS